MPWHELTATVARRDELVVSETQTAVGYARTETRTEYSETRNALLKRMPIFGAEPAVRATPRAGLRVDVVVADGRRAHEPCPRLFQYGANTCADSA
jgi:uncharacterized Rossmann fold enzyme